jgi:hypothetical protein
MAAEHELFCPFCHADLLVSLDADGPKRWICPVCEWRGQRPRNPANGLALALSPRAQGER